MTVTTAGVLAALALTGCGSSDTNTPTPEALRAALAQRGVQVCASANANSRFHGATAAHWYGLSHDCHSVEQAVVLGVISFDNSDDRNAAFNQLLYRMRFAPNNLAVLRFNNSVVLVSNIKNRDVAKQVIGKLENLGAR